MTHQHQHVDMGPVGQTSQAVLLNEYIDLNKASAINNKPTTYIKTILNSSSSGLLQSDIDEQMIIIIPFNESVRIKSITFYANSELVNDNMSPPNTIHVYVNNTNLDFNDCESTSPIHKFELNNEQLQKGMNFPVKLTKFSNVQSLTFYVPSNSNNTDTTYLNRIDIYGSLIEGFNVNNIKKIGEE